jgi:hypothetical protein
MKTATVPGSTSQIRHVFIGDSASTVGAGKTALAFGDITAYYVRSGGTLTALTLVDITTLGTWDSDVTSDKLGFKLLNDTNAPGIYEIHLPDNILVAGADTVVIQLRATGAVSCNLEIQLDDVPADVQKVAGTAQTPGDVVALIGNIANVGSPSYAAPSAITLTTYGVQTNTFASVDTRNSVYHSFTDSGGTLSVTYHFTLDADEVASSLIWAGRWIGSNDTLTLELYDWNAAAWVTLASRAGTNTDTPASDYVLPASPAIVNKYTSTSANGSGVAGKVNLRISGTGLSSCTLRTDQLVVGKTTLTGGIANGSTVTFAGSNTYRDYVGNNWTCVLGTQDISGSIISGASSITGISSGTTPITVKESDIGAATMPPGAYRECGFGLSSGTFTAASAGLYNIDWPKSRVAGGGTPVYDWATATGTVSVNFRGNLGGGYHYIDGDVTISVETLAGGTHTFDGGGTFRFRGTADTITVLNHAAGKTSKIVGIVGDVNINGTGGTVVVKGCTGTITDNSGGAVTISKTEAVNLANISDGVWDEPKAGHTTVGTFGLWLGTKLWNWLGALAGKTADSATRAEINATTAGAGYDETTDSLEALRDRGDAAWITGTSGGTGTYACTWTVNDGTTALQGATVAFWLNGVLKGTGTTSVTGTVSMSLDAATYTVAISLSGYTFANTAHAVSATASTWTKTFSMAAIAITAPTDAGTATGRLDMHKDDTTVDAHASIYVRQTTRRTGTGHGDSKEWRELVSNALGVIEAPFWKSQSYEAKRGLDGTPVAFTVGTDSTFYLPSILGEP